MNKIETKKKPWTKVTVMHSAEIAVMHQKAGMKIKEILEQFPQYSPRSVYRHAKKQISEEAPFDKRKTNKGRPPKLTVRDKRNTLRAVPKLRRREGGFTASRVALEAGVNTKVCVRTVRKVMNRSGYRYLQARNKGLVKLLDMRKRIQWCKKMKRLKLGLRFWTEGISFYLDGKGFAWKRNPQDQARAPKARVWRKRSEGLDFGCTGKAGKAGVTNLNFMVAISHGKGVVLCQRYHGTITGATIVLDHFPGAFQRSANPKGKCILQDNCPRQNSAAGRQAIYQTNGKVFKIPARSPDLNPIENYFNLVTQQLQKDAKERNITCESKQEFEARIKKTMTNFDRSTIDKIIESMPKRVDLVLKGGGKRLKY